jgi:hypothetical protein
MARHERLDVNQMFATTLTINGTELTATATELNDLASGSDTVSGNVGTAGSGVTAEEYGNAYQHSTVLTIAKTDAFTVADDAALADGHLIYTFPAGEIVVWGASFIDCGITLAEDTDATPDVGLGTLEGSDSQATLSADDAACENILTGQTWSASCDGTVQSKTAMLAAPLVIADADDHTVFFNIAATWSDTAGTDLTGDLAGTVVLLWDYIGNPA